MQPFYVARRHGLIDFYTILPDENAEHQIFGRPIAGDCDAFIDGDYHVTAVEMAAVRDLIVREYLCILQSSHNLVGSFPNTVYAFLKDGLWTVRLLKPFSNSLSPWME